MASIVQPARIFISCGQADGSDEVTVAIAVASELRRLGYEPYIAKDVQSLASLRENIFPQLRDTEYFLFIDFRREPIGPQGTEHRGSLFSHQELAVASFLDVPLLAFREGGVKKLDGLVSAIQANCIEFTDRSVLPSAVAAEVVNRGWTPNWRNQLQLSLADPPCARAFRSPENVTGQFFHIDVFNRHRYVNAHDCTAYLRSVVDRRTGAPLEYQTVELKWAGYYFPSALISPGSYRKLDAVWVAESEPTTANFNCFADSSQFVPGIRGSGTWDLTYEVVSSNVPGGQITLPLSLGASAADIRVGGKTCLGAEAALSLLDVQTITTESLDRGR